MPQTDKINRQSQGMRGIKALKEILGLLRVIKEYTLDRNRTTELILLENMSTALTPVV